MLCFHQWINHWLFRWERSELKEAMELLHGVAVEDYRYHCLKMAAFMLILGGKVKTLEEGISLAEKVIADGSAFAKFREMVIAQYGDVTFIDDLSKLPQANFVETINAEEDGWVKFLDAREVGETSVDLGAGRAQKGDKIDPAVGILVRAKIGDRLKIGQTIFEVHANDPDKLKAARVRLKNALKLQKSPVERPPYFYGVIGLE